MHETDRTHTPKADNSTDLSWSSTPITRMFGPASPESQCPKDFSYPSPKSIPRNSFNSCHSPETEDTTDLDSLSATTFSSPSSSRVISQIIGAEDDYFDRDQEQVGFSHPDVNMSVKHNFC
ncbi:hypothetical protein GOODEAATRI_011646 [Goodea atripinnis]|uniref:Uncharacterized protein n=1 Tax=Goodea atripinnis TaxID=208336 RepID=A0ABV0MH04_9TELE